LPAGVSVAAQPVSKVRPELLGGVTVLAIEGATAIAYHAWNNRGLHPMTGWVPVK
jgi:hypothetical protein